MKKVITKFGYVFTIVSIATMAFTSCSKEQEEFTPQSSANVDSQELPVPPTINKEIRTGVDDDLMAAKINVGKNGSVMVGVEIGMRSEPQGIYSEVRTSDSFGECVFSNMPQGQYVLQIEKNGFDPIVDTLIVSDSLELVYNMIESL
ncbi:carboxypeptidase regulatory-like domain-containing protein [bacterium SCSIO 12741]|nr:carboxypeptidase regulatory-like domain-containing protein [bacterium SCSIO 12741]